MAFKSIGTLAGDVLLKVEATAAHAGKLRKNLGSAPLWEEGESEAPLPSLEVAPANRVKGRGAKPRQVQNRGVARAREEDDTRSVVPPALVLVVCNDGRGLPLPPRNRDFARPGSRPSLRIVGGSHASSPTG
jgi:hypothetical protein